MTTLDSSSDTPIHHSGEDYWHEAHKEFNKCPQALQVHIIFAVVISFGSLLGFHYLGAAVPDLDYYYWMYVIALFVATVLMHYYFNQGKVWEGISGTAIVLNVICVLSWAVEMHKINENSDAYIWTSPWWMIVTFVTVIILMIYYYVRVNVLDDYFRLFGNLYWFVNVGLFFVWLFFSRGFPWFAFPLFLSTMIIAGWKMWLMDVKAVWLHMAAQLTIVNLLVFFLWEVTDNAFPWFLIVVGVSVAATIIAFCARKRGSTDEENPN